VILTFLALYVFLFYQNFTPDPQIFKFISGQSAIFQGDMALTLIVVIIIIIIERYANRTDTKAVVDKRLKNKDTKLDNQKSFFSSDEIFKRTNTNRSMTVSLKTQKTSEIDLHGNSAQDFLKEMYGQEDGGSTFDEGRTKITNQQKTKYTLHWVILVCGHLYVFWALPIAGNLQLYGKANCDEDLKDYYGCMNFHENAYLRLLYVLILLYLVVSSLQLSYGFPIMKKPSSTLQYYNDLAKLGADIYIAIPFAVELRCLLDFTMSKTSLDIFQFYQLFNYHYELYAAKVSNHYYGIKVLGLRIDRMEKCIFGVFISSILMVMLVGPFFLFSEYGGLVQSNPVLGGNIEFSFIIEKNLFTDKNGDIIINISNEEAVKLHKQSLSADQDKNQVIRTEVPYSIFKNEHPYLRLYDKEMWESSEFDKMTETNYFDPSQVQECMMSSYSDDRWAISSENFMQMREDIKKATSPVDHSIYANISLGIKYNFERSLPETAKTATKKVFKKLDYTKYEDCITRLQLNEFINLQCSADPFESVTIVFSKAFIPNLVLGQSLEIKEIDKANEDLTDQKHDLLLTYRCD